MAAQPQGLTRREFVAGTAAGAACLAAPWAQRLAAAEASARARPNLVVIYTDDHDLDEIGCYGGTMPTPHMDSLARDGMRFSRYYVCSAVCSPSRYNLLAGRCASRSARQQGKRFPPGGPVNIGWEAGVIQEPDTLASVLQAAGYRTGMVGKWHQGQLSPLQRFADADADPATPAVQAQLAANYENLLRSVKSCGFDYAEAVYSDNVDGGRANLPFWLPRQLRVHNMEWVTASALSFLEQAAAPGAEPAKPFFLYMAPTLVHSPSAVASLRADPRATSRGPVEVPRVQPSRESVLARASALGLGPKGRINDKAAGAIWLDDGVGAVLQKLEALGLAGNTLVLLASDNGNAAKFTCYDGGARLPCVARWPGVIPAGAVCDKLVSNLDVAPTFFELAGVTPPPAAVWDGVSIVKALRGDPTYTRDSVFLEITTERAVVLDDGFKYMAVRYLPGILEQVRQGQRFNHWCQPLEQATHTFNADTTYPAYFDLDQLYDLREDPRERRNLAGDPAFAARLDAAKARLRQYSAGLPHTFAEFTAK